VLMRMVVVRRCESEYCMRSVCLKECWFVSVAFSGDVAAPPRKRGWGRILFFRPYRYARAGTHAWLELAASPGRESFTSVSGGVDSLPIRGGGGRGKGGGSGA